LTRNTCWADRLIPGLSRPSQPRRGDRKRNGQPNSQPRRGDSRPRQPTQWSRRHRPRLGAPRPRGLLPPLRGFLIVGGPVTWGYSVRIFGAELRGGIAGWVAAAGLLRGAARRGARRSARELRAAPPEGCSAGCARPGKARLEERGVPPLRSDAIRRQSPDTIPRAPRNLPLPSFSPPARESETASGTPTTPSSPPAARRRTSSKRGNALFPEGSFPPAMPFVSG